MKHNDNNIRMKGKEKASMLSPFSFLISKGFLLSAFCFLLFVSCSQEEFFSQETDADAVKVVASINKMQTRVAYSGDNGVTNFVNGDAIKVVNLMRTSKNEATYTTTDGTNWTTTDAMVWNSSSKNKFQAWYPVAEYSSYDTFTIPTDQSDATKLASADWMTASTGEIDKPGNGVLDLNFQHRLAKVTVNLTFSSQYPEGNQHVSDFTFYTNEETQQAITALANSETSYTAILRPGEYADESYFIYLMMDDIVEHYVLGKTTAAINFEAGKHYTFTLKVGKDVVSIDDVTVADWDEEDIDGGVAEEVFPSIDGTDYASLSALQNAVKEKFSDEDVTSVTLDGNVTDEVHAAVMSAISEVKTEGAVVNGNLVAGSVTYTVNTFSDALTAWTEGTTLTLLGDATYDDGELLIEDKAVILDLNGYTLTLTETSATARINVAANAELTIRDSGENGQIDSYNQSVQGNGILYLESGTLNKQMQVGNTGTFYMTGGKVLGRNFQDQNCMAIRVVSSAIAYISGGTLQGYNALVNDGMTNISGNPTIIGEDSERSGSAIRNTGSLTISGEPVITAAGYGHLYVETPITLNIQPTEGTWKVFMWSSDIEPNNGVFAIPGADINLDASKFESLVEGYEVKRLDDGSLALVATATTE